MAAPNQSAVRYENSRLRDYTRDSGIERGSSDLSIVLITLLLTAIGLVMMMSASYATAFYSGNSMTYIFRQSVFVVIGIPVMFIASRMPMSFYKRMAGPLLVGSIVMLAAVLVIGDKVNGARRWIKIVDGVTVQPSEFVKIAMVLYFSALICHNKDKMHTFRYGIAPFAGILVVIVGLMALEPHVSGIIIIGLLALTLLFVGGVKLRWFIGGGLLAALAAPLVYRMFDHVQTRIQAWLDPFSDMTGGSYQVVQSLYAIGSGGLLGLGLGNSRQKFLYLPEPQNDYIFSIVCEELGFIGAILVLALFMLLILRGYWVARHARDRFSMLVAVGITTQLALQTVLNVAVCTNFIPCTGISLPFFSYGGTAMIVQLGEIGILMSVSRDIPERA